MWSRFSDAAEKIKKKIEDSFDEAVKDGLNKSETVDNNELNETVDLKNKTVNHQQETANKKDETANRYVTAALDIEQWKNTASKLQNFIGQSVKPVRYFY
eukprot:GHVL01039180.1.p1 GENE.GHVL01039180.1~~GHVL01039180.1.p1  ORF type:complete len:100 (-),score=48.89 GHVL01039180.1:748-1047(-)